MLMETHFDGSNIVHLNFGHITFLFFYFCAHWKCQSDIKTSYICYIVDKCSKKVDFFDRIKQKIALKIKVKSRDKEVCSEKSIG